MLLNLLIGPITTLIERLIPDKEKSDEAKAEMMNIMIQAQAKEMDAKSKVIVAEATGESWLQRNWRPMTMVIFLIIIFNNFIIVPYLKALGLDIPALPIPPDMWTLLWIGIGGYIGSRGAEKVAGIVNRKKYFNSLRNDYGPLTQDQVDVFTKALERAENGK
jgi:hypothetical protein